MEPASVIGLVGSIVGVADVVTRSINKLSVLRTRYRQANFFVSALLGQLCTIKAALTQLADLQPSGRIDILQSSDDLRTALETSLDGSSILIVSLEEQLDQLSIQKDAQLDAKGKLSFLWHNQEVKDYLDLLDRQVNALNLLLQVIQCKSLTEQQALMQEDDSITVMRLARECTDSLYIPEDARSRADRMSVMTEDTARLSIRFDFDHHILGSRVYQAATKSNVRTLINGKHIDQNERRDDDKQTALQTVQSLSSSESRSSEWTLQPKIVSHSSQQTDASVDRDEDSAKAMHREQERPTDSGSTSTDNTIQKQHPTVADDGEPLETSEKVRTLGSDLSRLPIFDSYKPFIEHRSPTSRGFSLLRNRNKKRSRKPFLGKIKEQMEDEPTRHRPNSKILLLGALESGKSTLLKSMKLHWEGTYTRDQRETFRKIIFTNVVGSMQVILEAMKTLELCLDREDNEPAVGIILRHPCPIVDDTLSLAPEVGHSLKSLWADAGVQYAYGRRREYHLNINCSYYFESIERITGKDYVPTDEDVLKSRVKTTGITEVYFQPKPGLIWHVFDVGGVWSERKKWGCVFDRADCVIVTVDVTCFDRALFENETINRMQDSLNLFNGLINGRWFRETAFVLLFTNTAKLTQQLEHSPVKNYLTGFTGENMWGDYIPYITKRFESLKKDEGIILEVRYVDIDNGLGSMAQIAEDACNTAMRKRDNNKLK